MSYKKIDICFTSDENYVQHMAVAIASILKNSDSKDEFHFFVVDDGISDNSKNKIEKLKRIKDFEINYLEINKESFKDFPRRWDKIPLNSYYLLKVPNVLKSIDRLLFLDCDIIVRTSLKDLFNIDFEGNYIIASEDILGKQFGKELGISNNSFYFNSGVFVLNCKKWREDDLEEKSFNYVRKNGKSFRFQDQEVLNGILNGRAKKVSFQWNFQFVNDFFGTIDCKEFEIAKKDPFIIHYITADKPWKKESLNYFSGEYWKYFIMTPFYDDSKNLLVEKINFLSQEAQKYSNLGSEYLKLKENFDILKNELDSIKGSHKWRIINYVSLLFSFFFPHKTIRRKILRMSYKASVRMIKKIRNTRIFEKKKTLIMTILTRDEVDVIDYNIKFHLSNGVDYIIATDNGSIDGTRDILLKYQKKGVLYLIDEKTHNHAQSQWVNRMAKIACEKYKADYVFHCDADEFWMPKYGDLKKEIMHSDVDVMKVDIINVLPKDEEFNDFFAQSFMYAVTKPLFTNDLKADSEKNNIYLFKYPSKVMLKNHKGFLPVGEGNHDIIEIKNVKRGVSDNVKIYHFPLRGKEHFFRKVKQGGSALENNKDLSENVGWHWRIWYESYKNGTLEDEYKKLLLSKDQINQMKKGGMIEDFYFKNLLR